MLTNAKSPKFWGFLRLKQSNWEADAARFDPQFMLHPLGHQNSLEMALARWFLLYFRNYLRI